MYENLCLRQLPAFFPIRTFPATIFPAITFYKIFILLHFNVISSHKVFFFFFFSAFFAVSFSFELIGNNSCIFVLSSCHSSFVSCGSSLCFTIINLCLSLWPFQLLFFYYSDFLFAYSFCDLLNFNLLFSLRYFFLFISIISSLSLSPSPLCFLCYCFSPLITLFYRLSFSNYPLSQFLSFLSWSLSFFPFPWLLSLFLYFLGLALSLYLLNLCLFLFTFLVFVFLSTSLVSLSLFTFSVLLYLSIFSTFVSFSSLS